MSKIIAIINARSGSKRITNKNLINFGNRPLINWTIIPAIESKIFDHIYVNTDSEIIAKTAKKAGAYVPFLRPKKYSGDKVSSALSTNYFINRISESADYFYLLQPTSPLRSKSDIIKFDKFVNKYSFNSVVSVSKLFNHASNRYNLNPDFSIRDVSSKKIINEKNIYFLNGAIYFNKISSFIKYKKFIFSYTKGFKMSKKNSIDIDTYDDYNDALKILKNEK